MNERERWIVYPLLFLALGAGLRDKLREQTNTKLIRCQELVVTGEEVAGQEGATLVHISAASRSPANPLQVGQVLVNGLIQAQAIQAGSIQAESVNADNYYFRRLPFAPALLRAMPGVSPADWLRALQQSMQSSGAGSQPNVKPPAAQDESTPPPTPPAK